MTAEKPARFGDPADEIAQAKAAARSMARTARCALDAETCRDAAMSAAELLVALPELTSAGTMLVYGATPEELDPAPALWPLRQRGVRMAYPRIEGPGELGLHLVARELDLVPGPFGLAQPSVHALRVERAAIDAVLVPGVGFDVEGRRLGYGGGYYDRLLPTLRADCVRVGYCYDEQLLSRIPAEEHDEHVDIIVTPSQVLRVGRNAPDWA